MGAVRRLVDELRRRGVTVHEWPGWDGRGNADGGVGPRVTQIDPVGAVIHHTGSNYGAAYAGLVSSTRPELAGGALCNFAGNEDGSLTVIASGLAWHAGAGVGPSLGRVLSKVPNVRNRMNRVTVGLEVVYPGNAPMRPAQYRAACVFAKTVADLFGGGDLECVRAHAETNGNAPGGSGKWDPGYANGKTIDMAAFRRDAAHITAPSPEEDDMNFIVYTPNDGIWTRDNMGYHHMVDPATDGGLFEQGYKRIRVSQGEHLNWVAAQQQNQGTPVDAKVIADAVANAVTAALANLPAPSLDPAALAAAIEDQRDNRARDNDPATGPVS